MHCVVIERPRFGHSNRSRKWGGRVDALYEGPNFVSSARRRQYGWNSKELSDLISPLVRYLHAQVGRPWDKVYSEIKRALPKGLHADHIWSHVKNEIHLHCWEEDRKIWHLPRYAGGSPIEVTGLYVHPRTGLLLRKIKKVIRHNFQAAVTRIHLSEKSEYRYVNSIWYYLEFGPVDPLAPAGAKREILKKKQLNRKQLRELRATYPSAKFE